jgi:hypothetical protein
MLSITGIFGIAAYSVSRRLKEFGIRMALGAHRTDVLQTALGRAFKRKRRDRTADEGDASTPRTHHRDHM